MLTSLNWLKDYVGTDLNNEQIESLLTNSGTKVETIEELNENTDGIVAGRIEKIEKHPNADKLLICTVDVGKDTPVTIITSATNVFEGALVPVALAGSTLSDGTVMNETEFRGVNSEGMFCSVEELGMNSDLFTSDITDGIYILPDDFVSPGEDLKGPLWIDDSIIDIELTANRGDCQSVYGVAREFAAAQDSPIKSLEMDTSEGEEDIKDYLSVEIESDLCPRYVARMFKVNEIKPSPMWMQLRLLNSGVRPINNIVDVTNYVMLEMGQPLHAFDYNSIGTDQIVVRTGNTEKTVTTLDEKEREITPEMLMITNGEKPIAVAGIMGGLNSEITEDTEYVVLESANFDKTSIRLTSRALNLRTESAARYEKGIYPSLASEASRRAAHLYEQIGAATPIAGLLDIVRVEPKELESIEVDIDWLNGFLGTDLEMNEVREYLNRLFLGTEKIDDTRILVNVPEYRQDLLLREDIAEEVARLFGYNNIPSTIMRGETFVGERTEDQIYQKKLASLLRGMGFNQTMTTSFTGPTQIEKIGLNPDEDRVEIMNPLGEESSLMRSTLIPSQLEIIALNNNRGTNQGALFEIQKTYHSQNNEEGLPTEVRKLVISEFGKDYDFFDLKGKLEKLFSSSGIKNVQYVPGDYPVYHPGRNARILVDGEEIGVIGEVHPTVVTNYDLPKKVFVAELDYEKLLDAVDSNILFRELPRYPDTTRDLALVVDEDVTVGEISEVIKEHAGENLEALELFDVYTGNQIEEGKKSLAFSLTFRHPERTLTDEEIDIVIEDILTAVGQSFAAKLRS